MPERQPDRFQRRKIRPSTLILIAIFFSAIFGATPIRAEIFSGMANDIVGGSVCANYDFKNDLSKLAEAVLADRDERIGEEMAEFVIEKFVLPRLEEAASINAQTRKDVLDLWAQMSAKRISVAEAVDGLAKARGIKPESLSTQAKILDDLFRIRALVSLEEGVRMTPDIVAQTAKILDRDYLKSGYGIQNVDFDPREKYDEFFRILREEGRGIGAATINALYEYRNFLDARAGSPLATTRGNNKDAGFILFQLPGLDAHARRKYTERKVAGLSKFSKDFLTEWGTARRYALACFTEHKEKYQRVAYFRSEGLEVLTERKVAGSCDKIINVKFDAGHPKFYYEKKFPALANKIVASVVHGCAQVETLNLRGYSDNGRAQFFDGQLDKGKRWSIDDQRMPKNFPAFLKHYDRAKTGDVESQSWVGFFYDKGIGVAENKNVATDWFEKAARAGHAYSQGILAARTVLTPLAHWSVHPLARWASEYASNSARQGDPVGHYLVAYMTHPFLSLRGAMNAFMTFYSGRTLEIFKTAIEPGIHLKAAQEKCEQAKYAEDLRYRETCDHLKTVQEKLNRPSSKSDVEFWENFEREQRSNCLDAMGSELWGMC